MRPELIKETVGVLEEFNFNVLLYLHSCLDVAAQKKSLTLLLKVLENIDGLRKEHANELKRLSSSLNACPLLIGETTKAERMLNDVIYDRYEVPSITIQTFRNTLAGVYPEKIYSKGRIIAEIDGDVLKKARKRKGISAEKLAEEVNLTRESIYLYEHEKMRVKYEIAEKIGKFLNIQLIVKKPYLRPASGIAKQAFIPKDALGRKLMLFDFDVAEFSKLNFDLIAKDVKDRVVIKQDLSSGFEKIMDFSDFFKSFLAFVAEEKHEKGLPVISHDEIAQLSSKSDFISLLKERAKNN